MDHSNPTQQSIKGPARLLVNFVVLVHLVFFLLEAVLWMQPAVYTPLIKLLDNPVSTAYPLQALVLKNLFINQGFYNLFVAGAGLGGQWLASHGRLSAGSALVLFMCIAATGAGVVLACSTNAYLLAAVQALPAAVTFAVIYPLFKVFN
jgi:putative membrane protein